MTWRRTTPVVLAAAALAAVPAAAAPERNALVRPGKGIGKVDLGMSFAQVKQALGRPMWVNRSERLGFGRLHVEYAWDYGTWLVAFQGERGKLRVVRVATSLRNERTRGGIGVGSRVREILQKYPRADCRYNAPISTWIYVKHADGRLTAFRVQARPVAEPPPPRVSEVIVKEPARELGVSRVKPCLAGWRELWG